MSTTDAIALPLPLPTQIDRLRARLRRRRRRLPPPEGPEGPDAGRFVWWWLVEIAYQWWVVDTWLSAQHGYAAVVSVAVSCLAEVAYRRWFRR